MYYDCSQGIGHILDCVR